MVARSRGREPCHLNRRRPRPDLRQVIVHLHPQPRVGGATEGLLKTYSHFRRNASSTRDDTVKLLARDGKGFGGFHNGQPQLVNIRLDQVARMERIFHRHWCSPSSVQCKDMLYICQDILYTSSGGSCWPASSSAACECRQQSEDKQTSLA